MKVEMGKIANRLQLTAKENGSLRKEVDNLTSDLSTAKQDVEYLRYIYVMMKKVLMLMRMMMVIMIMMTLDKL
jgi:hypothetical protein